MNKNLKRIIIASASVVVLFLVAIGIWYAATHGTLTVKRDNPNGSYTLQKAGAEAGDVTTSTSQSITVESGAYSVRYKNEGAQHIKYVEVPGFLGSVAVEFEKALQRKVERVASSTLDQIVQASGTDIISVNSKQQVDTLLRHPSTDPTGLGAGIRKVPFSNSATIVVNNRVVGFTSKTDARYDNTPTLYDPVTDSIKEANKTYPEDTVELVAPTSANSNTFGVYVLTEDDKISLDVYKDTTLKNTFTNVAAAAVGETGIKTVGLSANYVAMAFGDDFLPIAENSEHFDEGKPPTPAKDYVIKVYDLTTSAEVRSVNLGKINTVGSIQIGDDGKYVSVVSSDKLVVYDTATGKKVYTYDISYVTTPTWLDNEKLLFASVENGIFSLDVPAQSATTIFSGGGLRIKDFNIAGERVQFTGFSNRRSTSGSSSPDGYIAYLNQEAKDDNALIKQLPVLSGSFKLESVRDTIYAATQTGSFVGDGPEFRPVEKPSDALKKAVDEYIQKNFPGSQYKLVFGENL